MPYTRGIRVVSAQRTVEAYEASHRTRPIPLPRPTSIPSAAMTVINATAEQSDCPPARVHAHDFGPSCIAFIDLICIHDDYCVHCFTSGNYFAPSSGTYYCHQRIRLSARVSQKPYRMYPKFTKLSRIGCDSVGYSVTTMHHVIPVSWMFDNGQQITSHNGNEV